MAIGFVLEDAEELRPQITVFGVGGAGSNAVGNMIASGLTGVTFCVANTDSQALSSSPAENRVQIGRAITQGLGAGARPEIGRAAAEESLPEIVEHLRGSHMCFIAAGMGGGTGTGAAPVIARAAKELDILTVGVVTKPFQFEGAHRMRLANQGIDELQQYVDTLIVIPNQNLFRIANERTTFAHAFQLADQVLHSGVRGVTDLMLLPGLINLDFADVRSVMSEMGKAMMGTGEAEGEHRAIAAAEAAISNPLLDDVSLKGARAVLINITGGEDLTLFDVDEATNRIRNDVDPEANIIFGAVFNENMTGRVRVSVVATGIDTAKSERLFAEATRQAVAAPAAQRPAEETKRAASVSQPMWPTAPAAPAPTSAASAADRRKTTTFSSPSLGASAGGRENASDPLDDLVRMVDSAGVQRPAGSVAPVRPSSAPSVFRQAPIRSDDSLRPAVTAQPHIEQRPAAASGVKGLFGFMRSSREEVREPTYQPLQPSHAEVDLHEPVTEPVTAGDGRVSRTAGDANGEDRLEIPAFLRRQIN